MCRRKGRRGLCAHPSPELGCPGRSVGWGRTVVPAAPELLHPGAFLSTSVQVKAAESGGSSQALCTFSFAPKARDMF